MYFSLVFVLTSLPFLIAAVPPAKSSASRGIAVPITKRSDPLNGVVDTSKLQNGIRRSVAKIQRGFTAYERNTGVAHPLSGGIKLSKRDSGSNPLTDDNSQLWYGTISVGTPAVSFIVDIDTGSSDLILPLSTCGSNCSGHTLYNPNASSTAQNLSWTFSGGYGDGSTAIAGEQYSDVVSIAGLTAKSQTLGAATQYPTVFGSDRFLPDGLMGMAFQSNSAYNASPPFQTLISQGVVTSQVFGLKIATSGSELFLGGTNSALYKGNFTWVPLTTVGYWQATFNNISVNRKSVVGRTAAIFDSGTTQIVGDPKSIAKFFKPIKGAKAASNEYGEVSYTIPCTFDTPISIDVGGKIVNIPPTSFNLGRVSPNSSTCMAGAAAVPGLTGKFWVLGDVFLQNVYSAWDVGGSRIGFATLA